ncbi:MAG TPA: hypothetical protein PLJ29_09215 [Leptospiraceae bacterium]|nr:hypothetical protein [Leptospiraceae bacterium]HNI26523.1 hypothetical protein [Leptospiraceae bacterium]
MKYRPGKLLFERYSGGASNFVLIVKTLLSFPGKYTSGVRGIFSASFQPLSSFSRWVKLSENLSITYQG